MNERIDKLANIWANRRSEFNGTILYTFSERALEVFAQKFAELIVLECAVIVGSMEEPHQDIAKLIKQHFGVEE
jgi:hypothetical protein